MQMKPQVAFRAPAEMRLVVVAVGVARVWRVNEVHCLAACEKAFVDLTYVQYSVPKATTDAQAAEPSQRRRLTARGGTIGYAVRALSSKDDSDRRMIGARSVLGN